MSNVLLVQFIMVYHKESRFQIWRSNAKKTFFIKTSWESKSIYLEVYKNCWDMHRSVQHQMQNKTVIGKTLPIENNIQ